MDTYIPNFIERGSEVPDTSVNLTKLHPIEPTHIRHNAVMANKVVSTPSVALYMSNYDNDSRNNMI